MCKIKSEHFIKTSLEVKELTQSLDTLLKVNTCANCYAAGLLLFLTRTASAAGVIVLLLPSLLKLLFCVFSQCSSTRAQSAQ